MRPEARVSSPLTCSATTITKRPSVSVTARSGDITSRTPMALRTRLSTAPGASLLGSISDLVRPAYARRRLRIHSVPLRRATGGRRDGPPLQPLSLLRPRRRPLHQRRPRGDGRRAQLLRLRSEPSQLGRPDGVEALPDGYRHQSKHRRPVQSWLHVRDAAWGLGVAVRLRHHPAAGKHHSTRTQHWWHLPYRTKVRVAIDRPVRRTGREAASSSSKVSSRRVPTAMRP